MDTLLIVDGNNLLFQTFYGLPTSIKSKSGKPINGVIGFISYLLKMMKMTDATHALVVFDRDTNALRKEINSHYKANRTIDWASVSEDESPFSQEADILKCLEYLSVKAIYSVGMEADDTISSVALEYKEKMRVVIASFDSDFFQLIGPNVSVLRYRGKNSTLITLDSFISQFSFPPSSYSIFKAIVGDNSDNIKGVDGIGKKRATAYLTGTCSLLIKEKIEKERDKIRQNHEIIKLRKLSFDIPKLEEMEYMKDRAKLTNSIILSECGIFN